MKPQTDEVCFTTGVTEFQDVIPNEVKNEKSCLRVSAVKPISSVIIP